MVEPELGESGRERLLILAAWAALSLAVFPVGDFPLNDDWDFAAATWSFARTGEFEFTRYTFTTLRLQILWGALWTRLFGESFHVLRLSTAVLSIASLLLVHDFLLRIGVSRFGRLIGTAALLVHPIFFWSSFTYMTQIPYLFLSVAAMRSFTLALSQGGSAGAGAIWTAGSWFVRQTGVVHAAAALTAAAVSVDSQGSRRRNVAIAAGAAIVLFLALLFGTDALTASAAEAGRHALWNDPIRRAPFLLRNLALYSIANLQIAALLFAPLTAGLGIALLRRRPLPWLPWLAALAIFLVPSGLTWLKGWPVPSWSPFLWGGVRFGNIVTNLGLGPPTLPEVWRHGWPYPVALGDGGRAVLTLAAAAAGATLVTALGLMVRRVARPVAATLLAHVALATAILAVSNLYFDRYSLDSAWALAVLIPAMVDWGSRPRRIVAMVLVGLLGVFSVGATAAYFSWNRARYELARSLVAGGVPPEQVDAGYEWNAFVRVWPGRPALERELGEVRTPLIVAFQELPGYRVVAEAPWSAWGRGRSVLAMVRDPGAGDLGSIRAR